MKIVQITSSEADELAVLTDDGRIFTGYWKRGKFNWTCEVTPDPHKLTQLSLATTYGENQDES